MKKRYLQEKIYADLQEKKGFFVRPQAGRKDHPGKNIPQDPG
jgi:hypothetical protein